MRSIISASQGIAKTLFLDQVVFTHPFSTESDSSAYHYPVLGPSFNIKLDFSTQVFENIFQA